MSSLRDAFAHGSKEAQIVTGIRRPSDYPECTFLTGTSGVLMIIGDKIGKSSLSVGRKWEVVATTSLDNLPVPVL